MKEILKRLSLVRCTCKPDSYAMDKETGHTINCSVSKTAHRINILIKERHKEAQNRIIKVITDTWRDMEML